MKRLERLDGLLQLVSNGVAFDIKLFTILNKVWTANSKLLIKSSDYILAKYDISIESWGSYYTDTLPINKTIILGGKTI